MRSGPPSGHRGVRATGSLAGRLLGWTLECLHRRKDGQDAWVVGGRGRQVVGERLERKSSAGVGVASTIFWRGGLASGVWRVTGVMSGVGGQVEKVVRRVGESG